mmetsp:Transcript_6412/g.18574  ORF Transcript_6412/g.18574 Transcript_6412/m.18574 type:complete len:643 (+) Transcript_6412:178-2106(+)
MHVPHGALFLLRLVIILLSMSLFTPYAATQKAEFASSRSFTGAALNAGPSTWTAQEIIDEWESRRRRVKPVPFYIYDTNEGIDAAANVAKCVACGNLNHTPSENPKHNVEGKFLAQLLRHRWRVMNHSRALFLIPPVCIGEQVMRSDTSYGFQNAECARVLGEMNDATMRAVKGDSLWERRPHDHIFFARHFKVHQRPAPRAIWIHSERKGGREGMFSSPYSIPLTKTARAFLFHAADLPRHIDVSFAGQAKGNQHTRQVMFWMGAEASDEADLSHILDQRVLTQRFVYSKVARYLRHRAVRPCNAAEILDRDHPGRSIACHGRVSMEQLLSVSTFTLAPKGDTPTTGRFYEAISHGTIPIVISNDFTKADGYPFPCLVPYEFMTARMDQEQFHMRPLDTLRMTIETFGGARAEKRARALMVHFSRDLLWDVPESRVSENILLWAAKRRFECLDWNNRVQSREVKVERRWAASVAARNGASDMASAEWLRCLSKHRAKMATATIRAHRLTAKSSAASKQRSPSQQDFHTLTVKIPFDLLCGPWRHVPHSCLHHAKLLPRHNSSSNFHISCSYVADDHNSQGTLIRTTSSSDRRDRGEVAVSPAAVGLVRNAKQVPGGPDMTLMRAGVPFDMDTDDIGKRAYC